MQILEPTKNFKLFSSNKELFSSMLNDINNAKKSICFETYRIEKTGIGIVFRDALAQKAKSGVSVTIVVDGWGTGSNLNFFEKIIENGGKVAIFNTPRLGTRVFTQSHRRNHRKILVIDKTISYIGSSNITNYSLPWRELNVRIEGTISKGFNNIVETDFKHPENYLYFKSKHTRSFHYLENEILRDIPNIYKQKVMKKFLFLIERAKNSIYIETPYFLPGFRLRKAISDAVQRGVVVDIVMPHNSDVRIVDYLRNHYLGVLYKKGVNFHFYMPSNLHSKLMIIDGKIGAFGSSNFDYRSFRYMHEVVLVSSSENLLLLLNNYQKETLTQTEDFSYEVWINRPLTEKILAFILKPIRYLF